MARPYFLSKPLAAAITTEAQSVSGMKPIFTSFFSGASEPAAQTEARRVGARPATRAAVPSADCVRNLRRDAWLRSIASTRVLPRFIDRSPLSNGTNKKGVDRALAQCDALVRQPGRRWPCRLFLALIASRMPVPVFFPSY